jgi:hypothetical protein
VAGPPRGAAQRNAAIPNPEGHYESQWQKLRPQITSTRVQITSRSVLINERAPYGLAEPVSLVAGGRGGGQPAAAATTGGGGAGGGVAQHPRRRQHGHQGPRSHGARALRQAGAGGGGGGWGGARRRRACNDDRHRHVRRLRCSGRGPRRRLLSTVDSLSTRSVSAEGACASAPWGCGCAALRHSVQSTLPGA